MCVYEWKGSICPVQEGEICFSGCINSTKSSTIKYVRSQGRQLGALGEQLPEPWCARTRGWTCGLPSPVSLLYRWRKTCNQGMRLQRTSLHSDNGSRCIVPGCWVRILFIWVTQISEICALWPAARNTPALPDPRPASRWWFHLPWPCVPDAAGCLSLTRRWLGSRGAPGRCRTEPSHPPAAAWHGVIAPGWPAPGRQNKGAGRPAQNGARRAPAALPPSTTAAEGEGRGLGRSSHGCSVTGRRWSPSPRAAWQRLYQSSEGQWHTSEMQWHTGSATQARSSATQGAVAQARCHRAALSLPHPARSPQPRQRGKRSARAPAPPRPAPPRPAAHVAPSPALVTWRGPRVFPPPPLPVWPRLSRLVNSTRRMRGHRITPLPASPRPVSLRPI